MYIYFFNFLNLVTFIYCKISFVLILKWRCFCCYSSMIHPRCENFKAAAVKLDFLTVVKIDMRYDSKALITSADGLINWAWTRRVHCNQPPFLFTALHLPSECREGKSDNQEIRKSSCWCQWCWCWWWGGGCQQFIMAQLLWTSL